MTEQSNTDWLEEATESAPARRDQIFEVGVFLFLIVPSMVTSFFIIKTGTAGFGITAFATILRDLALVALILLFLWRNREPIRRIGWTAGGGWREVAIGIILAPVIFYAAGYLDQALQSAGLSGPSNTQQPGVLEAVGAGQLVLAFVLVVVVAIAEETIFRGYLMLRFKGIWHSPALAIVLSAFVFSLGHGYEGTAGVITVGLMGAAFAIIYQWRGSLVAPMILHFIQDFISIVLAPLITGGS
jgi:membrane protease YdiL (CAAX protease family)